MKNYVICYETTNITNMIDFNTVEEINTFFINHKSEIKHYTLYKWDGNCYIITQN